MFLIFICRLVVFIGIKEYQMIVKNLKVFKSFYFILRVFYLNIVKSV